MSGGQADFSQLVVGFLVEGLRRLFTTAPGSTFQLSICFTTNPVSCVPEPHVSPPLQPAMPSDHMQILRLQWGALSIPCLTGKLLRGR